MASKPKERKEEAHVESRKKLNMKATREVWVGRRMVLALV
jgi:hypothetical protein